MCGVLGVSVRTRNKRLRRSAEMSNIRVCCCFCQRLLYCQRLQSVIAKVRCSQTLTLALALNLTRGVVTALKPVRAEQSDRGGPSESRIGLCHTVGLFCLYA